MLPTPTDRMIEAALPDLPGEVRSAISMLSYEERALLFGLGRTYTGAGSVIDAGCFVGGSTVALASGISTGSFARSNVINTYDLLRADPQYTGGYVAEIDALKSGSSLVPFFEKTVGEYRDLVSLHEGDVLLEYWDESPVEILFIDICKSWAINAHVVAQFFPALIPGVSTVVQQDLVHWRYPWCAIVMEDLSEHFEYLGWTWYASSVWKCHSQPTRRETWKNWRDDIGLERGLDLLHQSAERHGGWGLPNLELSRATLMYEFGENTAALAEVDRVERLYGHEVPYIGAAYAAVRDLCTAQPESELPVSDLERRMILAKRRVVSSLRTVSARLESLARRPG